MKNSSKSNFAPKELSNFFYVTFTTNGGVVMSVNLFKDFKKASDFFVKEVRKEFDGIRRDFSYACNFKETIDKTEATITWYIPAITLIRQNHIKGINQKLRILLNRKKYCHHFCHAEVQNSRLQ